MSYTILAPAFYNSWDKVKYLKQSAERWKVPITFYGFGEPYKGWYDVQLDRLLKELQFTNSDYILYTDASDALVNGPLDLPTTGLLGSEEADGQFCAGGWLADRMYAIECLKLVKGSFPTKDISNPQEKWRVAIAEHRVHMKLDHHRKIFQVADEPLDIVDGRIYNPRTNTFPFIVHWAGGYTDPEVGKAALIEPYWKQLGY